jgi:hypothetical protein
MRPPMLPALIRSELHTSFQTRLQLQFFAFFLVYLNTIIHTVQQLAVAHLGTEPWVK